MVVVARFHAHGAPNCSSGYSTRCRRLGAACTASAVSSRPASRVAGCGAVRDVYVRETSTSVVIDLVRGTRTAGIMCPAILVPRQAEVPLPSPLGSRVLQQDAASAGVQIAPAPTTATTATAG